MKQKIASLFFCLLILSLANAQYKVKFILKQQSVALHDSIYITGTFSNWDSTANRKYLMQPNGKSEKSITLYLPAGSIGYKFHRGSWLKVEKDINGNEVADRLVVINKDTVFTDIVLNWRDVTLFDQKQALLLETVDTNRVNLLSGIAGMYAFNPEYYNADSALLYTQNALQLQQKVMASAEYKSQASAGNSTQLISLQEILASLLHAMGNYPKELEIRFENLKLAKNEKDKSIITRVISEIADAYTLMKDYQHGLTYGKMMDSIMNAQDVNDTKLSYLRARAKTIVAKAFYNIGSIDSALYYAKEAVEINTGYREGDLAFNGLLLADIYAKKGDDDLAFYHYNVAYKNAYLIYNPRVAANAAAGLASLFKKHGHLDSALYYANNAMQLLQNYKGTSQAWGDNTETYMAEISPLVAELYKAAGQPDSAYKYLQLSVVLKDSLYNSDRMRQFQTLTFNEAARQQQLEQQRIESEKEYNTKIKMYGLTSIMAGIVIVAFILYRNNKLKQKANTLLLSQKQEIENTLGELKATQAQLIQSEKMASLGELTAGIAHEIQNPLNFVNNFSEVNGELVEELQSERSKGKGERDEVLEDEIINDIKLNLEKINHHGKRADAIVKGMLQHSRTSSSQKELTDINALCDEYVRLAYHGLRAKDKSFNAKFETRFDVSLPKVNVVPQDVGRVMLNVINNAFYAVDEKKKQTGDGYEPTVLVITKKSNSKVEIKVEDNGNGIPQNIVDKIFQPFFTTKPTGQGTGLGLSLAYDIVKAHGGEIKVEAKEGEGCVFVIRLPVVKNGAEA